MLLPRYPLRLLFVLGFVFAAIAPATADRRAFIVSIDKYTAGLEKLKTPNQDAAAIAKALTNLGFKPDLVQDPTRSQFDASWVKFRSSLKKDDVVVFYFGGHGIQVSGANFLLPADTPSKGTVKDILNTAINFHEIMEDLEAQPDARKLFATIYILDACRDNPFRGLQEAKEIETLLGQSKGLATMQSVYGAFVMYSAGADEVALDRSPVNAKNSVFVNRLIPLLEAPLSLVDMAKRVQVQVADDAKKVKGPGQHPAYFDGILGQYYLAQLDRTGNSPAVNDRLGGGNVIRLGGFATWDSNCQGRPAPRVSVSSPPKFGHLLTRFENVTVGGTHFGNSCEKSVMRGMGVYYVINDEHAKTTGIDTVRFDVHHWSVSPTETATEVFEIDLAQGFSKRLTPPPAASAEKL